MIAPEIKPEYYFPVSKHDFSFTAGLKLIDTKSQSIFQIDEQYTKYITQKNTNRELNFHQYVCEKDLDSQIKRATIHFILNRLKQEWAEYFSVEDLNTKLKITNHLTDETLLLEKQNLHLLKSTIRQYADSLDAIMSQLQEDLGIVIVQNTNDYVAYLHLNFPNFWAAGDKIGNSFLQAHAPVPNMEKINQSHQALNNTLCSLGPFERFTWGLSGNTELNQHPSLGNNTRELKQAIGEQDLSKLYLRVERQVTVPFKDLNFYLFFIRTYFNNLSSASSDELKRLIHSLETMPDSTAKYKGIEEYRLELVRLLRQATIDKV